MRRVPGMATATLLLILVLILSACGASTSAPPATREPVASSSNSSARAFTVGLVPDTGGVNDTSFNHLALVGIQMAHATYGVTYSYVATKSASDYMPTITHFAQAHTGLTIAVGTLMAHAVYQVAKRFPKDKFALVDGSPETAKGASVSLPNVANLYFKEQESGYLVGVIAGLMEKDKVGKATHGIIGVMGGKLLPSVNRYIAGYVAGAKSVDPGIKVLLGYSQNFADRAKGKSIGLAQANHGADIFFAPAGLSGLGYLAAAQQKGMYGIGVDANQGHLGRYIITSAIKKVNVAVEDTIVAAKDGKFTPGDHRYDLHNGATGFAPPASIVPKAIVDQTKADQQKIANGSIVPPTTIPPL
jgi:basic membrane protein A and related proteins